MKLQVELHEYFDFGFDFRGFEIWFKIQLLEIWALMVFVKK